MSTLPGLGRFQPKDVNLPGIDTEGEVDVYIETNLTGEAIKFTLNEDISNIVSTGSLIVLNADISELGEIQSGILGSAEITEEDESLWGTLYAGASAEPNQLVQVTEIIGNYSTNVDGDGNVTYTTDSEDGEKCTTYWRIVSFSSYVDEEGVPYCDIKLESMVAIATQSKIVPREMGSEGNTLEFYAKGFKDALDKYAEDEAVEDGYQTAPEIAEEALGEGLVIIENNDEWLTPFFDKIKDDGFDFTGSIEGIEYIPASRSYPYGESTWQAIDDILSFNKIFARFKRDKSLVYWTVDEEGFGDIVDIGEYGEGLKLSYSKEGVFNYAKVTGYLGEKDDQGVWIADKKSEKIFDTFLQYADNILNGEKVEKKLEIDGDYKLENEEAIKNWGKKEMYRSCLSARGTSISSDSMPLAIEAGMTITGTSQIAGTVDMLVMTLNRTTDAKENTTSTSIGGRAKKITGPGDAWL